MTTTTLPESLSQKFKFWSFVSMVLLVFVHGYNLELRYLQPWTAPPEPLTFTSFTEYWLANGLLRFRIPMLFIISGYLYAWYDATPNRARIAKRARTLLLPYVIWSAVGLTVLFLFEEFTYTRGLVERSHIAQIDDTRMFVHDYHWYEVLFRWLLMPASYQLWFIRVLFIYNAAYPLIRTWVLHRTGRWIFFSIAFLLWLATAQFLLIDGEGLLFFSLGVWIQKSGFSIVSNGYQKKYAIAWVVFILAATLKTWLAFEGPARLGNSAFTLMTLLHKITVVSGLVACWFGLDFLVQFFMRQKWFVWLSSFSFIIYALHAPAVAVLIDGMFDWLAPWPGYRMLSFVLLPLMLCACCVLIGLLIRTLAPKTYAVLTGGRGF